MSFYDDPENVKQYIQMCENYDGLKIYQSLSKHLPAKSTILELGSGAGLDIRRNGVMPYNSHDVNCKA